MAKRKTKPKSKPQQSGDSAAPLEEVRDENIKEIKDHDWFVQLINPSPEKYKNELHYDAKIWLSERESDVALKGPFDLLTAFAIICAELVTDILILSRSLKSLSTSDKASFSYRKCNVDRLLLCFQLYALSAVHHRLTNLYDEEWKRWPVTRGSHCFEVREISTLFSLISFCTDIEVVSFEWILRWIWSITCRPVDCEPASHIIKDAISEAGILNFIQWCHKFNLNMFMYSKLFPWSGDVNIPELIPDECDPEAELDRIILELKIEYHEANDKSLLDKTPTSQKNQPLKLSRPLSLQQWSSIFGVSINKVREWKNDPISPYHFQKMSERKWSLPLNELPAEYLEKYRKSTS